jgi:hypothetical protein
MKCPGQDSRYWKPDAVFEARCPECGGSVEFFKDDTTRLCKMCGHRLLNPRLDFGCASYCRYAEQCIGNLPPELIADRKNLLKDRVAIEMKRHFGRDFKRIGRAMRAARYAEAIGRQEGGDLAVILIATYLYGTGERVSGDNLEGPGTPTTGDKPDDTAREILTRLAAGEELIREVCQIIEHHDLPGALETINFKCFHDARLLACLAEEQKEDAAEQEELVHKARESFLTDTGRTMAKEVLGRTK